MNGPSTVPCRDLNPSPLSFEASALLTELTRPDAIMGPLLVSTAVINVVGSSSHHDEAAKLQPEPMRFTMIRKRDFLDNSHVKSGRYYLPESPPFNQEGLKSGLYSSLISMASMYPCGATYQRCLPNAPMIRFCSPQINDLRPTRIQYWDNSFLLIKDSYPVGVKIPTETETEWLTSTQEDEKTILYSALDFDTNVVWGSLTIPNPTQYLNIGLYFVGHLDIDNVLADMRRVVPLKPSVTDELTKDFGKPIQTITPKFVS